jgi:hypothetical protein
VEGDSLLLNILGGKMESKGAIIVAIVAIFVCLLAIMLYLGGFSLGGGYEVTVSGNVGLNLIGGWSLDYEPYDYDVDTGFFGLFFGILETDDIEVELELSGNGVYRGKTAIGKMGELSDSKSFTVTVHNVPAGVYDAHLIVWEVDSKLFGLLEGDRSEKISASFEVVIEEIG